MKWDVSDFNERFNRWKNGESYWDLRNINLNSTVDIPSSVSQDYIKSYVDDYFRNYDNGKDNQLVEYIKTIENPDSVGYDPKTNTWNRVQMEGFDPNTYGYGLDYRYFDNSILNDDGSMDHDVMLNHVDKKLKYYEGAAKRNGVDKNKMSNDDYLLSIGAMYRGDAKDVYNAVAKYNILKPGEFKKEIYNKYKRQGLNERIRQSEKFFNNKKQKSFVKNYNLIEDLKNQNSFIPKFDNGKTGYVRQNNNPIMFDNQGNLVDQITGEKGTMLLPNVTIRPNKPREYKSAFDGSLWNFVDVTNALSGGIFNRFSATQNLRAAYDTYKYLKGDITRSQLGNSLIYGNSGIVSDDYAKQHPIKTMLLNIAGDMAGAAATYKQLSKLKGSSYDPSKYDINSYRYRKPAKLFITPESSTKDITPYFNLLDRTEYGNIGRVVDEFGNIDFDKIRGYVNRLNDLSARRRLRLLNPNAILNDRRYVGTKSKNGITIPTVYKRQQNLLQHSFGAARSAMKAPTPKGYTKQEQVEAALLHDIGKLFGDYGRHAEKALDILDAINYPLTENVSNAIVKHMSPSMLDEDNLTKSVKFSDVSHGIDPDLAFHMFPNLVYPRDVKTPVYYVGNSFRDQAKNINKIFRKLGYDKIDINDTQENQMDQVADRIDQMRTFLRGIAASENTYKDVVGQIPEKPTGGQRAHLFDVTELYGGKVVHESRKNFSERYGISPDTRDGIYIDRS